MIIFLSDQTKCKLFCIHVHTLPRLIESLYHQSSIHKTPNKENFNLNIKFAHVQYLHIQPASKGKSRKFTCITKLVHTGLTQTHCAARTFKGDAENTGNHSGRLGGSWEGRVTDLDWIHRHTHLFKLLHTHSITGLSHYAHPIPRIQSTDTPIRYLLEQLAGNARLRESLRGQPELRLRAVLLAAADQDGNSWNFGLELLTFGAGNLRNEHGSALLGWRMHTRDETIRPLSLGTLRPWRRIQYLFRRMAGDGELPLESSMAKSQSLSPKCPPRTRRRLGRG